jgi:response regulator RpfG family c-di-GMP phosphodiesterase
MIKKLLIVDDNVDLVSLLYDIFEDLFDIIETAYEVEEACQTLTQNTFSVVLLDINLNNRNGAEVVKFVQDAESNSNKNTPFVIMSGIITPKFIDQYKDRFAAIFMKPYDNVELKKTIEEILVSTGNEESNSPEQASEEIPDLKYSGPFSVDALKEQVDQVMIQVKKSPKLKQLFRQAKIDRNADNYILTHIGMIVNISAAICIKMDWGSDKTLEKFVYCAYLHDMALATRPELARINTFEKLEVLKDTLTEDDYRIVFEHPNIAAKTIAGMNEIPPDVEMMIRQHHEMPNQSGFPT